MKRRAILDRWRTTVLWIAAFGFGAIGVAGTRGYISESVQAEKLRLAGAQQTIGTVVAKKNLPVGSIVNATTMAMRQMPQIYLPETAVPADRFEDVVGLRLNVPMTSGQALLSNTIGKPSPGFSERVGHGIRAMTIAVDEVNSVSGMLSPGDRIDLLFSTRRPDANGQSGREMTAPLMQDLLVLATGQRTVRTDAVRASQSFSTITVEVTPDEAQRLVLAQGSGRLTALLRNPQDRREQISVPMDVYTLLGIARPELRKPVTAARPEVIVGGLGPISEKMASQEIRHE